MRIRELLGKVPTAREIKNHTDMPYNSFHEYPLSKLQKECGDKPNVDRSLTCEDLIIEYLELEKRLGHKPNGAELDKYGKHPSFTYIRRFGSLRAFYKLPQINADNLIKNALPKSDTFAIYTLLTTILELKNELLEYNSLCKVEYKDKILLSKYMVENRFGSYKKLLDEYANNEAAKDFVKAINTAISTFKEEYK